jgi:putative ABC transport system permease protein
MIKNYFITAWRNLMRNKAFTILNLGGLTISLAACLVIFFWVKNEFSYDAAATNGSRVYRVALNFKAKGQPDKQFALTAAPLGPVLAKDIPEIDKVTRFETYSALLGYKNTRFFTDQFLFADSTFFDVFGFPLIKGNPHDVLNGPNSAVITEGAAKKYFGGEDPIGKTLKCNDTLLLKVAGIAKDVPATTHFTFEIVCAFRVLEVNGIDNTTGWWNDDYYTYLSLKNPRNVAAVNAKIYNIMDKYDHKENEAAGFTDLHFLQPLKSIHLQSNLRDELNANGSLTAVRILIAIAVFLLLVACVNYINLTTATSFKRAKEIGIRKVAGAQLKQLIAQFLSESVLIAIIALILAAGLAFIAMPGFNAAANTQLHIQFTWQIGIILIGFAVALGVVAGIYPAFHLSQAKPVKVFKNITEKRGSLLSLRRALVVFQFTLSVILIIATIVALQQLHYMQTQNLGFNQQQIVGIPLRTPKESFTSDILKKEMTKDAGVLMACASSRTPGHTLNNITTLPEGVPVIATQSMGTLIVDHNFIKTYGMEMAAGRPFSVEYPTDSSNFILNETAVREIGWGKPENAIGKKFNWGLGKKGIIVGVVKDFHFNGLQQKVGPVVMHIMPLYSDWYGYMSVKINAANASATIARLQNIWKKILPDDPFNYSFVDEDYNRQYETEKRLGNLSIIFSILTIFISCLGLFGLVMVAVSQRTKEIGVRKVLGASVSGIAGLLSADFLKLVIIAILIASPVAWWLMNVWLAGFAYHIHIEWWVFAGAALIAVIIAIATVSIRAVKAAIANPVKSLRTE